MRVRTRRRCTQWRTGSKLHELSVADTLFLDWVCVLVIVLSVVYISCIGFSFLWIADFSPNRPLDLG